MENSRKAGSLEQKRLSEIKSRLFQSHFCRGEFFHHKVGVFQPVVVIVVVAGRRCTFSSQCASTRASAVVLGVERVDDNGLRTFNLAAAEGTSRALALRLLRRHQKHMILQCASQQLEAMSGSCSRTCQAVRQEVHMRWPQGSIFTSLSFSAQILQSWKVEPISQYSSYCS